LAKVRRVGGTEATGEILPEPWLDFRADVAKTARQIIVSHRVGRKVAGPLHDETIYGPTQKPGEFVVRKYLNALTCSMVADIRDEVVKQKVIGRLKEFGIEPGRGQEKIPTEIWKEPLWMNEEKKIPIRKVRLIRREATICAIRRNTAYVRPGSTHHMCLFQLSDTKGRKRKGAVFVSTLEAIQRVKRREPIIRHIHPNCPDAEFLLSLSGNEMVLLNHEGKEDLYRYETGASTTGQMWFRHHTVAGKSSDKIGRISKKPSTFQGRKVTVDSLGRIRWAND
jgi:CRISPR-associated endonuclease Csn1